MTKVLDRLRFLQRLEAVKPGTSMEMNVNQSDCVVFDRGRMVTFNKEVACRIKSGLPKTFTGVVPYGTLTRILQKLPSQKVDVRLGKRGLFIVKTDTGIKFTERMEAGVLLPVGAIEKPKDWNNLHRHYTEAVATVHNVAATDNEASFVLTCIHTTPRHVEATDRYQAIRFRIKTGFDSCVLMKQIAIKHIVKLEMNEFSETEKWVHFRNPSGLIMSMQRHTDEFKDLDGVFDVSGDKLVLPKSLGDVADRAGEVSRQNKDNNLLLVKFAKGKMIVKAFGVSPKYFEPVKVKYTGKPFAVAMSPMLMKDIAERQAECVIDAKSRKLRIEGDRWQYVVALREPKFVEKEVKEKTKEKEETPSEE